LFFRKLGDEVFGQHITLLEEIIPLSHLLLDGLGLALAVTLRHQSVCGNAVIDQIAHHTLGTTL
jgi:hypothetical protein